jgi:hypothetical protein
MHVGRDLLGSLHILARLRIMSSSEVCTTFQDSYYGDDYHRPHELIKMSSPGKLWCDEFLKILKEDVLKPMGSNRPKDIAAKLHDLFLSSEDTLRKVEHNYDNIKTNLNHQGLGNEFFSILARGTMKEMQLKGFLPPVIIKGKKDRMPPIV